MERKSNKTIFFSSRTKDFYFLSNFFPSEFTENGIVYKTVEHYFQSEKFENDEELKHLVINAETPRACKRLGRINKIDPLT